MATRSVGAGIAAPRVWFFESGHWHMREVSCPPALLFLRHSASHIAFPLAPLGTELARALVTLVFMFTSARPRAGWRACFLGCWISVIATAASVHLVRRLGARLAFALSVNVGVWAECVISVSGSRLAPAKALPFVVDILPHRGFVARNRSIRSRS